ncbi:AMSH/STAMBP protein ubiquitin specific-protease [Malassezia cuniculi]|uniref:AMSH/STAMBP protein ubiquitin specific-protease n=1 Tax=Malassezia cuniculi TaxID=948313 RepID=A0AAF0ERK6_9BASI|nr:AMSH/STAMBP protein ubiquitin specific-protease [Malassezia cuniculi]
MTPAAPPQPPNGATAAQTSNRWNMRMNNRGLPVCRDLYDLYTAMILSLSERWTDWRFMLAFALSAAVQRVQALQFVQIERGPAKSGDNMLSLSQTKTLFVMDVQTAEKVCQAFVDAALLARLPHEEDDVYSPTPKGLHVVDRFVTRHGIATDAATNLLSVHPVCDKLLYLERDEHDDLFLSDAVVRIVFQRMVGLSPVREEDSSLGMILGPEQELCDEWGTYRTCGFEAAHALNWLLHFTSLVSSEEASTLAAHMVRLGWILPNGAVPPDMSMQVCTVRVDTPEGPQYGTFVFGDTYHVTRLGVSIAWQEHEAQRAEAERKKREEAEALAAAEAEHEASFASGSSEAAARSAGYSRGTIESPRRPFAERIARKLIEARSRHTSWSSQTAQEQVSKQTEEQPRPTTPARQQENNKPKSPTGSIRTVPTNTRSPSGSIPSHSPNASLRTNRIPKSPSISGNAKRSSSGSYWANVAQSEPKSPSRATTHSRTPSVATSTARSPHKRQSGTYGSTYKTHSRTPSTVTVHTEEEEARLAEPQVIEPTVDEEQEDPTHLAEPFQQTSLAVPAPAPAAEPRKSAEPSTAKTDDVPSTVPVGGPAGGIVEGSVGIPLGEPLGDPIGGPSGGPSGGPIGIGSRNPFYALSNKSRESNTNDSQHSPTKPTVTVSPPPKPRKRPALPAEPASADVFRDAKNEEMKTAPQTPTGSPPTDSTPFATPAAGPQTPAAPRPSTSNISTLANILHTSAKRKAYLAYLDAHSSSAPLHFWCEIERFRSKCRLASNGLLQDSDDESDAVHDMTAVFASGNGGPVDTPRRRAAQRPLLARYALRLEVFLAPGSEGDLGLSEQLVGEFKVALGRYAKREYSLPRRLSQLRADEVTAEAARESETQLANLLLVCAKAQKEVFKNLADERLDGFLAAHGQ